MTDDELQQRLRRLSARAEDDKDERFWAAMADDVRAAYQQQTLALRRRRRRLGASLVGALALAAALAFVVRSHNKHPTPPLGDQMGLFDDGDPGELIEDLDPAELDRVTQALEHKGA
jgi:hypothetical protein